MRLSAGTATLHLAPRTSVTLHLEESGQGTEIDLAAGTIVFSSPKPATIAVRANNAWVRPAGSYSTAAQVQIVNRKELRVSAQRSSLQFTYKGESAILAEGVAYRIILDPDDDPANPSPTSETSKKSGRTRRAFLLIAIAAAAAAAAAATVILLTPQFESPDRPGPSSKP